MKLISMVDYVESIRHNGSGSPFSDEQSEIERKELTLIFLYAKFLKQPLTLGMFVPCDKEGSILREPSKEDLKWYENKTEGNFTERYTYIFNWVLAKKRVLFEGFENVDTRGGSRVVRLKENFSKVAGPHSIREDEYGLYFYDSSNEISRLHTIEDLLDFVELTLTPSAIKKLGL